MILVFDLDDTLYEEIQFVHSGFAAVARFLAKEQRLKAGPLQKRMIELLEKNGRGKIFDDLLREKNIYSRKLSQDCISVYRLHQPKLRLATCAKKCLARFKKTPKYVVTDGNKNTQSRKVKALGIEKSFRKIFISRRYGIHNEKPSTHCFEKIAALVKVPFSEVVYIGDNPRKDFVGIKKKGFKTIRIRTGEHRHVKVAPAFEADAEIKSLCELNKKFLAQLK